MNVRLLQQQKSEPRLLQQTSESNVKLQSPTAVLSKPVLRKLSEVSSSPTPSLQILESYISSNKSSSKSSSSDASEPKSRDSKSTDPISKPPVASTLKQLEQLGRHCPNPYTQISTGKYIFATGNDIQAGISIADVLLNSVAQGPGISQRQNDAIYCYSLEVDLDHYTVPYTGTAISQRFDTASEAADHDLFLFYTYRIPTTPGASPLTVIGSSSNPPVLASGNVFTFSAQGTPNGAIYHINPVLQGDWCLHKLIKVNMLEHQMSGRDAIGVETNTSGDVVGTLGAKVRRYKFKIDLNYYTLFTTATSNAEANLLAMSYISHQTQASRELLGYRTYFSYTTKLHYRDAGENQY